MSRPRNARNVTSEEDFPRLSYVTSAKVDKGNLSEETRAFSPFPEDDTVNDHMFQETSLMVWLFCGFFVVCTVVGGIPWLMKRRKKHVRHLTARNVLRNRKNCYMLNEKIICDEMIQTDGTECKMGCVLKTLLPEEKQKKLLPWLVARKTVQLIELVGEGAFACVYKGLFSRENPPLPVAMKSLKGECGLPMIASFVDEALVMSQFHHANVLGLIAVTVDTTLQLPIIITPFMEYGDLKSYLKRRRPEGKHQDESLTVNRQIQFGLQIARGMKYLSELGYVHRDLATRNCLVNEFLTIKVGDFGLAKKLSTSHEVEHFKDGRLPVRWLAPESLKKYQFSEKSDVWSFGITLWEIAHFASTPYSHLSNEEILNFLETGGRLELHSEFPQEICGMVDRCFAHLPEERPSFVEIVVFLEDFITRSSGYLILKEDLRNPRTETDIIPFADSRFISETFPLV